MTIHTSPEIAEQQASQPPLGSPVFTSGHSEMSALVWNFVANRTFCAQAALAHLVERFQVSPPFATQCIQPSKCGYARPTLVWGTFRRNSVGLLMFTR
jgi:hypothetical protein